MVAVSESELRLWGDILKDAERPLVERFRALWGLKHAKEDLSIDMIAQAFVSKSELLKHELAYCLGQKANKYAIQVLTSVLEDTNQEPIVRHEAGEALAAIGSTDTMDVLKKYSSCDNKEVAETCYIGYRRLEFFSKNSFESFPKNDFDTIDPAPEFKENEKSIEELKQIILDDEEKWDLFDKYRALFSLRRLALRGRSKFLSTNEALQIICDSLQWQGSALYRHEVAFVLGQLADPASFDALCSSVANTEEMGMVRHESAEALGAIGDERCQEFLAGFLDDKEQVVMESCVIALDIASYNNCENFEQYAFVPK